MSLRGRKEVIKSPIVGTSQTRATIPSAMWIGVRLRIRTIRPLRVRGLAPAIPTPVNASSVM